MRTGSTFPHAPAARAGKTAYACKFGERRSVMEFQIPLSREDLLRPSGGSQFFVSEPLPARETVSRLEECRSLLDSSVIASIPECFPVFFSLLQNFLSVGVSVRESYWRIGVRGLEGVCHQVGGANFTGMTQTKKAELRNALKMMVYVVVQLVEEFETDATKPDSLEIVTNKVQL
ncbi:Condensin complex subunit 1 [Geodia barretti]|uniref:Condensin complex subunit 1 n=1 Tax=Geodia barretti TaxID=519541 RepID=A0AA35X7X2_GEOBA|nr:Condensin complex subunit 1 [Geodia barretti]